MKTYLSIDCDYFATDNRTPAKTQAERLIQVLTLLNLPVYVTLGHDLHAIDINRLRVAKIVNVDTHSDCSEFNSYNLEKFRDIKVNKKWRHILHLYSAKEPLNEGNWIHFCRLVGTQPTVEHWRPSWNGHYLDRYCDNAVYTIAGAANYKTKSIPPPKLFNSINRIKADIVGVGLAISPFWCKALVGAVHLNWFDDFFGTLTDHGVITDKTLYARAACCRWLKGGENFPQEFKVPNTKIPAAQSVCFSPVRQRKRYSSEAAYALVKGKYSVKIANTGVIPHLPSIKRAAEAFSQWVT